MTWPANDVNVTNTDSDTDSPLLARLDFLDLIQKFNQMRTHVSTFIQGLLDDANAVTARGTLGAGATGDSLFTAASAAAALAVLGASATGADTTYAFRANNLSDLASAATSRTNLGLGSVALQAFPLRFTIWVPAGSMKPRTTAGAASATVELATNKIMVVSLDFDQTTQQYGQFMVTMPKGWDEGTIKARFTWRAAAGTGDVIWGLQAVAISDGDALDAAFGTAVEVTDTLIATADLHQSAETGAITIAGTPQPRDLVVFQVYRNAPAGGDTLNATASLMGVEIYYNIDTLTDA